MSIVLVLEDFVWEYSTACSPVETGGETGETISAMRVSVFSFILRGVVLSERFSTRTKVEWFSRSSYRSSS